jgi:ABC-type antimicrobial peptide transport system permease subunit
VAVVNKVFVRRNLSGEAPLERRISLGGTPADANIAIIGVVDDMRDGSPGESPEPAVYRPFSQAAPQLGWHTVAVAIRTTGDDGAVVRSARRAIAVVAPGSAMYDPIAMEDRIAAAVAPERLRAILFGLFAATAVFLTIVGIYGLLASIVAESRHELGVRLSLGATRRQLISAVAWQAAAPTVIGIACGLAAAVALSRLVADRLHGVSSLDPMTYAFAAVVMIGASIVAASIPAYRASAIDPLTVLRTD